MSSGQYVSTPGDVDSEVFKTSSATRNKKRALQIFTTFTVDNTGALSWINGAFTGSQAIFCVAGNRMLIVFNGSPSSNCQVVGLVAVTVITTNSPASSTTSELQSSASQSAPPKGGTVSSSTAEPPPKSAPFSSGASGSAPPPNVPDTSTTAVVMVGSSTSTSDSGAETTSATSTAYPAPTTTGTPSCYDRSPYDGTVNDNYLILCDTDLPGIDLDKVSAANIADCIDQCSSYTTSSGAQCVAAEFDTVGWPPDLRIII
jgi:hypothetical protein